MIGKFLAALAALAVAAPASAESADHYRGGWRTSDGAPQVWQFVIRGDKVTGYYCTRCADATTVMPLEGRFSEDHGLDFTVRHLALDGTLLSQDEYHADLLDGRLQLTGSRKGANGTFFHQAIKDPRGPDAAPYPVAILPPGATPPPLLTRPASGGPPPAPPAPYQQPGPWKQLEPDDVIGVWLGFGTGVNKQFFIIRPDESGQLYGLACGRCDNPYTHGALENFNIEGETLTFDIVHQDWGEGDRLPFTRHVTARIAMNEMRLDARRDDAPDRPGIVASLVGPISLEATRGNEYGE